MSEHVVSIDIAIRLDRYLKRLIPSLTQGVIEQSLRLKKIKVHNKKSSSSQRLHDGDIIFIADSLYAQQKDIKVLPLTATTAAIKLAGKLLSEYLLFDNDHFMVINKPAGLPTQGGSKVKLSVDDAISYLNNQNNTNLKLVHRLDKETSGILLIAKTCLAANKLSSAFSEKIIEKKYFAITQGFPLKEQGEISCMLAKNREGTYDKVQEDKINGKLAITNYKVIKKLNEFSLIEFAPLTGRTHQLRVHAQMLGCPIVGDEKYGSKNQSYQFKNMLLHAKNIILPAQIFGEKYSFEAPLPAYFKKVTSDN